MAWIKPDNVAGSAAPAIMIGLFVAFGGILFGYDTGYATCDDTVSRVYCASMHANVCDAIQANKRHHRHEVVEGPLLHWLHQPG